MNGLERAQVAMDAESKGRKAYLAVQAIIFLAFFATAGSLYALRYRNINHLNKALCDTDLFDGTETPLMCLITNDNIYNIGFFLEEKWSDESKAEEYLKDLDSYDQGRLKYGCKWSMVFGFAGINFLLLAFNAVTLTCGVWGFKARILGFCCSCLLGCVNVAAIVTTAVFRFNTIGKLAALSLSPA